jgi:hypothetical protein
MTTILQIFQFIWSDWEELYISKYIQFSDQFLCKFPLIWSPMYICQISQSSIVTLLIINCVCVCVCVCV